MLHYFRFHSSKSRAFGVKYLGSDYVISMPKMAINVSKPQNKVTYCISGINVTDCHYLFDHFILIWSFLIKQQKVRILFATTVDHYSLTS